MRNNFINTEVQDYEIKDAMNDSELKLYLQEFDMYYSTYQKFMKRMLKRLKIDCANEMNNDMYPLGNIQIHSYSFNGSGSKYCQNAYELEQLYQNQIVNYEYSLIKKGYSMSKVYLNVYELMKNLELEKNLLKTLYTNLKEKKLYSSENTYQAVYTMLKMELIDENGNLTYEYKNQLEQLKKFIGRL